MTHPFARYRSENGLTQQQLAAKAKINDATLANIERFHRLPSLQMLVRLCDACDNQVSADEVIQAHRDSGQLDGRAA